MLLYSSNESSVLDTRMLQKGKKVMKQSQPDKYSLAWFKLAECVSRREKERALGVYRLLSHSLHDVAFALQLEGDLLLAFDDKTNAVIKYRQAVLKYTQQERAREAVAVFEHVVLLEQPSIENVQHLLSFYVPLKFVQKIQHYTSLLIELNCKQQQFEQIQEVMGSCSGILTPQEQLPLHRSAVLALVKYQVPQEIQYDYLHTYLDLLVAQGEVMALQHALTELHMVNPALHHEAGEYLAWDEKIV